MVQPFALSAAARQAPTRCVMYNPHFPSAYPERLARMVAGAEFSRWTPGSDPRRLAEADVLFTSGLVDPRPVLPHMPKLRWIHSMSTGVERLLVPEVVESEILVTNSSGCTAIPIAEHVIASILAFARQLPGLMTQQRVRQWKRLPAREIGGATVAIIGYGSIGQEVAKRARALGMAVLAVRRTPGKQPDRYAHQVVSTADVDEVLPVADYVVNALPLTTETHGFFDRRRLGLIRPGAIFINIGRGETVDQDALLAVLQGGELAGAALDVFAREPLEPESPLWELPNVMVTPHTSYFSPRTEDRVLGLAAENLQHFRAGLPLLNVVDKRRGY